MFLDNFIFGGKIEIAFECLVPIGTRLNASARRGGVTYDFTYEYENEKAIFKQSSPIPLQVGDYDFVLHWNVESTGETKGQACFKFKVIPLL